jgi:hypothetical protein
MPSTLIKISGTLPNVNPDFLRCIIIYLARGSEVLASAAPDENGSFQLTLPRNVALVGGQGLQAVVGPAGMGKNLTQLPNLRRLPINRADAEKEDEIRLSTEGLELSENLLNIWWTWCRWYCVSGYVVGPNGCPVPGAQVTVDTVGFDFWGYTKTPQVTVNADPTGHFTACFCWCVNPYAFPCWPCWPIWWDCWPWWWEYDILHVIDALERGQLQLGRSLSGFQSAAFLTRPEGSALVRGQGFAHARKAGVEFKPDPARTALVKRKLSNAAIRSIFPYWWWCCDNPNIVFDVTQGGTVILSENPATDTRWCLPDGSTVTLVANSQAVTSCPPQQITDPFAWTRVGLIPVDTAHISGGYAVGTSGTDNSDLAFAGTLDIYGGFGDPTVAFYQVNTAPWGGDPSRGGTPPSTSTLLSAALYNYMFIYDSGFNLTFSGPILMGPFSGGGLTNLYATQQARQAGPIAGLPAFPPTSPGDFIIWAYDQRLIYADSPALIGGGAVGAVDLTLNAFTSAFAPVVLPVPAGAPPPDTSAILTLTIDNAPFTTQMVTGITAYTSPGVLANQTGTGECPAYDVGPTGYVAINTTVSDTNGHLFEYYADAQFGHGNEVAVADPGERGYRINPLVSATGGVCGAGDPDYSCKGWVGGADVAYFPWAPGGSQPTTNPVNGLPFGPTNLPPDCCYEFRIRLGKRVTDGYSSPTLADGDFQTISLKFSS